MCPSNVPKSMMGLMKPSHINRTHLSSVKDSDNRTQEETRAIAHFHPEIWEIPALRENRLQKTKQGLTQPGKSQVPSTVKLYKNDRKEYALVLTQRSF